VRRHLAVPPEDVVRVVNGLDPRLAAAVRDLLGLGHVDLDPVRAQQLALPDDLGSGASGCQAILDDEVVGEIREAAAMDLEVVLPAIRPVLAAHARSAGEPAPR